MHAHITFVLDSSGSMSSIADDTRGGFNTFIQEQQEEDGDATFTLYDFNDTVEIVAEMRPIEDAPKLTTDNYKPGGKTALHDAITRAVDETRKNIDGLAPTDQPETVVVVVLTDGKENASETTEDQVRQRVSDAREERDWEFLFIGANQDAALTAEQMGMDANKSLSMAHDGDGVQAAQRSTSRSISRARQQGDTGGYDDEDRQRQDRSDNT